MKAYWLIFLFLLTACSENNETDSGIIDSEYLRVYSDSQCQKEVTEADTITTNIEDSLKLFIKSSDYDFLVVYDKRDIQVERVEEGEYLCKPNSMGTKSIIFVGDELRYINFKVKGIRESYYVLENTYTVVVPTSQNVKDEILYQLTKYSPQEGNLLVLYYEDLQSGIYEYLPPITTGTFTVTKTGGYQLFGDRLEMNFTLQCEDEEENKNSSYKMVQDLTDTFRQLYSQEDIESVLMTSNVKRFGRKYIINLSERN